MVTLNQRLEDIKENIDNDYLVEEYARQYKSLNKWMTQQTHGKASFAYPNNPKSGAYVLDIDAYEAGKLVDKSRLKMTLEATARDQWERVQSGELKRMPSAKEIVHKVVQKQAYAFSYKQGYSQFLHDIDLGFYGDDVFATFNTKTNTYDITGAKYDPLRYQTNIRGDEMTAFYESIKDQKTKLFLSWEKFKGLESFEDFLYRYIESVPKDESQYAQYLLNKINEGKIKEKDLDDMAYSTYDLSEIIGEEYYTYGSP